MFHSQCNQDKLVNQLLGGMKNGIFVDIGAHNGVDFSNSYFFEKHNNWTGICVEPNPNVFEKLKQNRSCICINKAIYNKKGEIDFTLNNGSTEMLSGIAETLSETHKKRILYENITNGGHTTSIKVECDTLENICIENNIRYIDYLTIDTEGSEYDILKTFPFHKIPVKIIDVEYNYIDYAKKINEVLYKDFQPLYNIDNQDLIYINRNLLPFKYTSSN